MITEITLEKIKEIINLEQQPPYYNPAYVVSLLKYLINKVGELEADPIRKITEVTHCLRCQESITTGKNPMPNLNAYNLEYVTKLQEENTKLEVSCIYLTKENKSLKAKLEESNCIQQALFNSKVEALKENESLKAKVGELERKEKLLIEETHRWSNAEKKDKARFEEENEKLKKVVEAAKNVILANSTEPSNLKEILSGGVKLGIEIGKLTEALKELEGES